VKTRAEIDLAAWAILDARVPSSGRPAGYAVSRRPPMYVEMVTMAEVFDHMPHAWSEFFHEFYRFNTADFFMQRIPGHLRIEEQALYAAAEYLCVRYKLPIPEWPQDPIYVLAQLWSPIVELCPDMDLEVAKSKAEPVFMKHGVVLPSRALIVL
jgi:hypothetical protein